MSYLGAIRFVLTTDGCSVSDVSIEPAKELRIEKLLCGKRVEDACRRSLRFARILRPPLPQWPVTWPKTACPHKKFWLKHVLPTIWNSLTRACVSLRSSVPAKITEPPKLKA